MLKRGSDRFVFSDLYRITISRPYRVACILIQGTHRLWAVLAAHEFPAKRMAVSEGGTLQHPLYTLRESTYFYEVE